MMPIPNKLRRLEDVPFPLKFPEPGQGVLGLGSTRRCGIGPTVMTD